MIKTLKVLLVIALLFAAAWGINLFLAGKLKLEWTKEPMAEKNPTEYVFNHPMGEVKQVIEKNLQSSRNMDLERNIDFPVNKIVKEEIGIDDYILYRPCDFESYVYRTGDRGRYYFMALQIHLDSLSEDQTRVKIITHGRSVITGYRPGIAHMSFLIPICQTVEPSTIEEYQVIYKIGRSLGEKMAPVIYPSTLSEETIRKTYYGFPFYNPEDEKTYDTVSPWE